MSTLFCVHIIFLDDYKKQQHISVFTLKKQILALKQRIDHMVGLSKIKHPLYSSVVGWGHNLVKGWESMATLLLHVVSVNRQSRPRTHCGYSKKETNHKLCFKKVTYLKLLLLFDCSLLSRILILLRTTCNQAEWEIMFSLLTMPFAAAISRWYCHAVIYFKFQSILP